MRVLVLNCGGSSLKYRLYDWPGVSRREDSVVIASGEVQRLGEKVSRVSHKTARGEYLADSSDLDHQKAIDLALRLLVDPQHGAIASLDEIDAVGHRVVHAGTRYTGSVLVTPDVVNALTECIELAPLHNPHNIAGIKACQALMPDIPQVAVFDNALHSNVPIHSYIYGLPYEYYERYGIRRYGFHGITFSYMREAAASFLRRPLYELRLVLLMLGSGWTACAMDCGRSIDISTGFTPTEGLTNPPVAATSTRWPSRT
jgi:acetate kinase